MVAKWFPGKVFNVRAATGLAAASPELGGPQAAQAARAHCSRLPRLRFDSASLARRSLRSAGDQLRNRAPLLTDGQL